MSELIRVRVDETPVIALQRLGRSLTGNEAERVTEHVSERIFQMTREYVRADAESGQNKRRSLGGRISGFVGYASNAIEPSYNNRFAVLGFNHPYFARAFGDVEIKPGGDRKYLSIPIAVESRNESMTIDGDKDKPRFPGFFKVSKAGNLIYFGKSESKKSKLSRRGTGKKRAKGLTPFGMGIRPLYLMLPEVHQDQDRERLPSDEQYKNTAEKGVDDAVQAILYDITGGRK